MEELLIAVLNSTAVQMLIFAGIIYVGGKLFGKFPKIRKFYVKYKGEMIRVIKMVESEIADNTDNKSLLRLDKALQYMIMLVEKRENRILSDSEKDELRTTISEVHNEIEPVLLAKKSVSV